MLKVYKTGSVYLKHFIFFKVILGKVLVTDNKYRNTCDALLIGNNIITNIIDFIPKKRNEE